MDVGIAPFRELSSLTTGIDSDNYCMNIYSKFLFKDYTSVAHHSLPLTIFVSITRFLDWFPSKTRHFLISVVKDGMTLEIWESAAEMQTF